MPHESVLVAAARRTPMGSFQGQLADLSATVLGAGAIQAVLASSRVEPESVDAVIMGCVLQANLGQAPARQAALAAGLPESVACTTVNKVCGSGMQAVLFGHDMIRAGSAGVVVAGGMESMSRAPHLLSGVRNGLRIGHHGIADHMLLDGLESPYDGRHMGEFAQELADRLDLTRAVQDEYAIESGRRALAAAESGAFAGELAQLQGMDDETLLRADPRKIPGLRPVFRPQGTITAASASSIADGAAALLLTSAEQTNAQGLPSIARILAYCQEGRVPGEFTTAPIGAIRKLWEKTGWQDSDVDLYEINEAFAAVVIAAERELGIDHAKVNVNGGACALGHPIGASGARILVTLIHALRHRNLQRGIAALCIGGGEALAVAVDLPQDGA
ncbi:MAG: thiolase family protein [Pseudomonadota bacterium]|nr:thiolase family protein [Pseudomonadota bacterium]